VPIKTEFRTITEPGWIVQVKPSKTPPDSALPLFLIHGLTGDERSMWVFTHKLPGNYYVFAPRAPRNAEEGGFSWVDIHAGERSQFEDYAAIANALLDRMADWVKSAQINTSQYNFIGFSQGAALCYVLSLLHPEKIGRVACLSGFLPAHPSYKNITNVLNGKTFFIAHGCMDEMVPVEEARSAVKIIQSAGAKVVYCEDDVGHKLGVSCFNGLEEFFSTTYP
jgi:phospholipase/carboxylesterase